MIFDELIQGLGNVIYNGCLPSRMHDLLAGELIKARLMKASRRFDEALEVVNSTLRRLPNQPEALFLKAQILCEGYCKYIEATRCLKKVIRMEELPDETIRTWSRTLLEEIAEQRRKRSLQTERTASSARRTNSGGESGNG